MDDYNNSVRVIDVEVVIEEEDVVIKWMCITYDDNEKRKEVIMRTTHGKEGKDASRWWDVQLNKGGCIDSISVSHLKEMDWLIRRSTRFLDSVQQDTSTTSQEDRRRRLGIVLDNQHKTTRKFARRSFRPYVVTSPNDNTTYHLAELDGARLSIPIAGERVRSSRKYKTRVLTSMASTMKMVRRNPQT